MKTWCLRRGRNMFRIDFGWCFLENVEEMLLSVSLRAWTWACVRSLYSGVCRCVLEVLRMWEWTNIRGVLSACVGFDPYTWDIWQKPYSAYFYSSFNRFTSICNSKTHSCHFCIRLSLYHPIYLHSHTKTPYFFNFTQIMNLTTFSFLQSSTPYVGRGSTNKVVESLNLLVPKTRGYVREAGFKPIISLLPKKSVSATLVQFLIERWWDTTHTFHIAERKMIVTPYDFYCMTSLGFEGSIISLDGVLGMQLGINMLGRKYSAGPSAIST